MALEPEQIAETIDDLIDEHTTDPRPASLVDHAAQPAHLATVEAYRALGNHIIAMGQFLLTSPWADGELAEMDREVCRLAHDIEQAKVRMLLLRDCQGATH